MPFNRRKFLKQSTAAGFATVLASIDQFANPIKPISKMNKADLKILATNWGFPGTLNEFCEKVKKEGYDGIEIWWPSEKKEQDVLFTALKKHDLQIGFLCGSGEVNYEKHVDHFKRMVTAAANNAVQKPLYINCHSGRDHFTFQQNNAFIEHTTSLSKETGIKIYHETHRARIMFAAHITRQFMERHPALRLTLDISHWCNVHESLLQDQQDTVAMALERTDHIHARIGHPEGPQINDPRAPEWKDIVEAHLLWWDRVVEIKSKINQPLTFLTEFGPPDYMPTLPYTRQPLANQWSINVYMMQLIRKRYTS